MRISRYYLLIVILSLLPFIGIFATPLLPHTSDGGVQIPRMAAYYKAFTDGHIPVRWAGDLNYGYGMPLFIFIYHTAFLIAIPLLAAGVSLVTSFKILLALSFLLSGIFMFLFAREWLGDPRKALVVTLLYQFAPYRLVEILVRGSIGGIYAYSFFPLVLYGIVRLNRNRDFRSLCLTALATALMIISHNSLALVFFGLVCWFALLFGTSIRSRLFMLLALGLGLGLAAWFWMPALLEHKYTYGDLFMKDLFRVNFPAFVNFFIPNFFDRRELRVSEISVHIGLFHSFVLLIAGFLLTQWRKIDGFSRRLLLFTLVPTAVSFLFMHPVTVPLWERISWLRQFQFPWRLLAVLSITTACMGPLLFHFPRIYGKRILVAILALTVLATAYYWQPTQGYDTYNEQDFWNYPLNTTYFGETDVIWSAGPASAYPRERVAVIGGEATVSGFTRKTQWQRFTVRAETPAQLVSHTQYFPGWRVEVDAVPVPIQFQDQNWRGLITFPVPAGTHTVQIVFGESKIRLLADVISVGTAVMLIGLLTVRSRKRKS